MSLLRSFAENIATTFPKLWELCYPRQILPPDGYPNPIEFSALTTAHFLTWLYDADSLDTHKANVVLCTSMLANDGMPTYFLNPDFCRAVAATRIPNDFRGRDIRWPLNRMLFVLHPQFSKDYFGFEAPFITANRIDAETVIPASLTPALRSTVHAARSIGTHSEKIAFTMAGYSDLDAFPSEYDVAMPPDYTLQDIYDSKYSDSVQEAGLMALFSKQMTEEEGRRVTQLMTALCVKLLMVVASLPKSVATGNVVRPAKCKHGRVRPALWSPNVIGDGYHFAYAGTGTGTHASPRMHMRWGHFTHQVKGARGADFVSTRDLPRKTDGCVDWSQVDESTRQRFWANHEWKWIAPTLVNAPERSGQ